MTYIALVMTIPPVIQPAPLTNLTITIHISCRPIQNNPISESINDIVKAKQFYLLTKNTIISIINFFRYTRLIHKAYKVQTLTDINGNHRYNSPGHKAFKVKVLLDINGNHRYNSPRHKAFKVQVLSDINGDPGFTLCTKS